MKTTMLVVGTSMLLITFLGLVGSQAVTVPVKRWPWPLSLRLPVIAGFFVLSALLAAGGCTSGDGLLVCAHGQENHISVINSRAAALEPPRPMLTGRVGQELHNAAASESETDGPGGKRSPMALIATDGQVFPAMDTRHRANCAVKHGQHQRPSPAKKDFYHLIETVANVTAKQPKISLIHGTDEAVPGIGPRPLIISTTDLSAVGDLRRSESSWRYALKSTVTLLVLGGVLLVCLGLLLGSSWTIQAFQPALRRQAEERRRLNEEWAVVHSARRQRAECPRCARPLSEQDWYFAPTLVEEEPDEDG